MGDLPSLSVDVAARPPALIAKLRHDLRTPLNHIIGYTEMLQDVANEELQPDLSKVREAALGMVRQIDHMFEAVLELIRGTSPSLGPTSDDATLETRPTQLGTISTLPPRDEPAMAVTPSAWRGASILVVDDSEKNREVLSRRLEQHGFRVEVADSGEAALSAMTARTFDLVLLDVKMPGLSGLDVLRRVRSTTTMSELPIIMATALDGTKDVVEALECGASDYVTKPINLPVLLARTGTQLALKEANEKIRRLAVQLEARNKFIRDAFGRYLTDEVVETLLTTPAGLTLGGESRQVTILLSDLRGFSSLSERLTPPQVVTLLNHYLGTLTEIVVKYGGTIDEFIGDAILVIFGAPIEHPDHAARAVACAVEMQLAMPRINEENRLRQLPEIEMGIGINTGEVVVGNIGSDRRAKYGVVGRNVNLASRIEALTVGGQVLISESTLREAGPNVCVEGAMRVSPKGARGSLDVFEVRGVQGEVPLMLPQRQPPPVRLLEPIPVRFAVLDGVKVPSATSIASIVALSRAEAVLAVDGETVPIMTTIKVQFLHRDDLAGLDAYAKVTRAEHHEYRVHFTVMSPEVERFVIESVAAAP